MIKFLPARYLSKGWKVRQSVRMSVREVSDHSHRALGWQDLPATSLKLGYLGFKYLQIFSSSTIARQCVVHSTPEQG